MNQRPFHQLSQHMVTDARVSPVMTHCTQCAAPLPEPQTAGDGSSMLLFNQCGACSRVYMLDFAEFRL